MKPTTMALTIVIGILLMMRVHALITESDTVNSFARCELALKEIEQEDRATITDNSAFRLHSTWLSQECEVRAGPEYVIRKYTFFKNGTFLMLRHHYVEESCSIATHSVIIRGSIKLLGASVIVPGATETKFYVDTVHIVPLNRQVAQKFGSKLNLTCGPQPRWRPYVSQLIYEQPRQHSPTSLWHGPTYNSLQAHSPLKKRLGTECLEPFGIEFGELRLLRVQHKSFWSKTGTDSSYRKSRFELLLTRSAPDIYSRWSYKATSLETVALIRVDTTSGCPICGSISRGTEFSPPLLHQAAALPAFIGGYWLSEQCESTEGGIWSKRQFQIYSGDKLWTGRWDYYADPQCLVFLYTVTAAGSYIQRAGRQRRHEELNGEAITDYFHTFNISSRSLFKRSASDVSATNTVNRTKQIETTKDDKVKRTKRSLTDNIYQHLLNTQSSIAQSRLAAMLRGHQVHEPTIKKTSTWSTPSGTTELDLHIAESSLIPGNVAVSTRCGAVQIGMLLNSWPRNCVPRAIEAPSTLGLRAKLGVNWNGQYMLLLGLRDDNLWEAPLRQCAQTPSHNSILRAHLRRSVGIRFGLLSSASSNGVPAWFFLSQVFLYLLHYLVR